MKKYFLKCRKLLVTNIFFIIICCILEILVSFMIKDFIDIGSSGNLKKLYKTTISSLIFIAVLFTCNYLRNLFQAMYIKNTLIIFKKDIFENIIQKNIKNFNNVNSANYISTLTNDITIIENDYFIGILQLFLNIVRLILGSIIIFSINAYIAIAIFVMAILNLIIPLLFSKKVGTLKKNYSNNLSNFTVKVKDIFSGFEVIKSFNIENKVSNEYNKFNTQSEVSKYHFFKLSYFVDILSKASGFLIFFICLVLGIYFVLQGQLTYGWLIAIVQLMNNITGPVANISSIFNKIKSVKFIEEKIIKFMKNTDETKLLKEKTSFDSNITFDNVNFSYNNTRKVLNNISFEIEKNKKYALVGYSGSGKSTILKLLLGYYDNFNGKIKIDGTKNTDIKSSSLYKLISVIHQNVFMFDDTVKNNITLFKDYPQQDIDNIIKISGLEELINRLPNGVNGSVGENGVNISGGEKQRISIARALIKNTPILVLDEATSSLDNKTSHNIESSILDMENLTCIVVTHKINEDLLKKYDKIIVLKNGEIYETGKFNELIKQKKYFYSLYNVEA